MLNKICHTLCIFEWGLLIPRIDSFNFRFPLNSCIPGTRFTPKKCFHGDYSRTYPVIPIKYDWSFTASTDRLNLRGMWEIFKLVRSFKEVVKLETDRLRHQHLSKVFLEARICRNMWTHIRHLCGDTNQSTVQFVFNRHTGFRQLNFLSESDIQGS